MARGSAEWLNLYGINPGVADDFAVEFERGLTGRLHANHRVLRDLEDRFYLGPAGCTGQRIRSNVQGPRTGRIEDMQADSFICCNAFRAEKRFGMPSSLGENRLLPDAVIVDVVRAIEP